MNLNSRQFKILFVCMGNICRSPAAEGVFRDFVEKAGHRDSIYIDSAGTLGFHAGSLPDRRMQEAAARRGYSLQSRARQVSPEDIDGFDLIVPMDHENYQEIVSIAGESVEHIRLLGSFLSETLGEEPAPRAVPDPYYGGEKGFELVLDMIESACPSLLDYCIKNRAGSIS